jgi:alpha-ribazole phosphatase
MSHSESKPLIKHQIYLVRHGDIEVDSGICYGQLDCAVSDSFAHDSLRLNRYFTAELATVTNSAFKPSLIISSPLIRCTQLADNLKQHFNHHPHLIINDAFKEINFGLWEGKSWEEIGHQSIEDWSHDLLDYTFPNGESAREFDHRVTTSWTHLMEELDNKAESQTVIIISHAGVIRSILSCFLHIPLTHSLSLTIDKMSVTCLNVVAQQNNLSRCLYINRVI